MESDHSVSWNRNGNLWQCFAYKYRDSQLISNEMIIEFSENNVRSCVKKYGGMLGSMTRVINITSEVNTCPNFKKYKHERVVQDTIRKRLRRILAKPSRAFNCIYKIVGEPNDQDLVATIRMGGNVITVSYSRYKEALHRFGRAAFQRHRSVVRFAMIEEESRFTYNPGLDFYTDVYKVIRTRVSQNARRREKDARSALEARQRNSLSSCLDKSEDTTKGISTQGSFLSNVVQQESLPDNAVQVMQSLSNQTMSSGSAASIENEVFRPIQSSTPLDIEPKNTRAKYISPLGGANLANIQKPPAGPFKAQRRSCGTTIKIKWESDAKRPCHDNVGDTQSGGAGDGTEADHNQDMHLFMMAEWQFGYEV